jgi:hypothetical protein
VFGELAARACYRHEMKRFLIIGYVAACSHGTPPSAAPVAAHHSEAEPPRAVASPAPPQVAPAEPSVTGIAAADCQQRLMDGAAEFAKAAPDVYPIYKQLNFRQIDDTKPDPFTTAALEIAPGRSWFFKVQVYGSDPTASATWTDKLTERGIDRVRQVRGTVLELSVSSERWGDYEAVPANHPLVKAFFASLGRAADSCVGG